MARSHAPALSAVVVLVLGAFILHAAGSGPPARGLPYHGRLELSGVPVTDTVPMTFRIYDDEAAGALLHQESLSVPVANGAFAVTLGVAGAALPESVFEAAELFVAVEVDGQALAGRQQIFALPQAVRAGQAGDFRISGDLEVAGGRIWKGPTAPGGSGADLGLYSGTNGNYVRFVTNNARFAFYSDGSPANGVYGTTPVVQIYEDGRVSASGALIGGLTDVTASATAAMELTPITATQNGFLQVTLDAIIDGSRGYVTTFVNPAGGDATFTVVGRGSVHRNDATDNHVYHSSYVVPIAKGDQYYVVHANTSSMISVQVFFRPLMP